VGVVSVFYANLLGLVMEIRWEKLMEILKHLDFEMETRMGLHLDF
jgi:hypothetical protein